MKNKHCHYLLIITLLLFLGHSVVATNASSQDTADGSKTEVTKKAHNDKKPVKIPQEHSAGSLPTDENNNKSGFDLGSASIGGIIMLFLKWLFDLISEKKKHALELKKRYFDKKMDVTLTTLNTHQFMLSQAKSSLNLIESEIKENLDPSIVQGYVQTIQTLQNQFFNDPKNMDTTITFFYGDNIYQLGEKLTRLWKESLTPWNKIIVRISSPVPLSEADVKQLHENIKAVSDIYESIKNHIREGVRIAKKDFKDYSI